MRGPKGSAWYRALSVTTLLAVAFFFARVAARAQSTVPPTGPPSRTDFQGTRPMTRYLAPATAGSPSRTDFLGTRPMTRFLAPATAGSPLRTDFQGTRAMTPIWPMRKNSKESL